MTEADVRWVQRFNNFNKALLQLSEAVSLAKTRELSKLEKQGIIQSFEYTHELAWNVLKDLFESRGLQNIYGSKDATREAFAAKLIANGDVWMEMIKSRNKTTHTYNEAIADHIFLAIINLYFSEFCLLREKLKNIKEADEIRS